MWRRPRAATRRGPRVEHYARVFAVGGGAASADGSNGGRCARRTPWDISARFWTGIEPPPMALDLLSWRTWRAAITSSVGRGKIAACDVEAFAALDSNSTQKSRRSPRTLRRQRGRHVEALACPLCSRDSPSVQPPAAALRRSLRKNPSLALHAQVYPPLHTQVYPPYEPADRMETRAPGRPRLALLLLRRSA